MTRVPKDSLPQRRLVDLLRWEIDKAMKRGRPETVFLLVAENPHSSFSAHVLYNLGERRVRWLVRVLANTPMAAALPHRRDEPETASLASWRKIYEWISDI